LKLSLVGGDEFISFQPVKAGDIALLRKAGKID
jgi:hypothetical protein